MGTTPVYGLPTPVMVGVVPDGPDGCQDLADKIELTLLNETRSFAQTVASSVTWSTGFQNFALTSVPLDRPVMVAVTMLVRVPSYQYVAARFQDGGANVPDPILLGASPWMYISPITLVTSRVFTDGAGLQLELSSSASSTLVENIRLTGMGFGWPS